MTLGSSKLICECPQGNLHSWQAPPVSWTSGRKARGCPFCIGQKLCECNCVETVCPDVAADFDMLQLCTCLHGSHSAWCVTVQSSLHWQRHITQSLPKASWECSHLCFLQVSFETHSHCYLLKPIHHLSVEWKAHSR